MYALINFQSSSSINLFKQILATVIPAIDIYDEIYKKNGLPVKTVVEHGNGSPYNFGNKLRDMVDDQFAAISSINSSVYYCVNSIHCDLFDDKPHTVEVSFFVGDSYIHKSELVNRLQAHA